ncbi:uncharacterized protein LOC111829451 [Capsella rubella]|uniref:uncharacterized protein LOC111829451 n=1 Tax=Capsella rubella TaxID=81985 RepID=UPI000CD5870A|nr:uncharacterized protein LOC111829451 [Capsella rubella]
MDLAQWLEESNEVIASGSVTSRRTNLGSYQTVQEELMRLTMGHGDTRSSTTMERITEQSRTYFTKSMGLKLYGSLSGNRIVLAIDFGATQNFISEELAKHLRLPIRTKRTISVLMGHGVHNKSKGVCKGIKLLIDDVEIVEEFLVLELNKTGAEVILGYGWLSKLGETSVNWQERKLSFLHNHKWITLGGTDEKLLINNRKVKMKSGNEQEGTE